MNTLARARLTSIRPGPRIIAPPRISCSQAAVASGWGLRKWTWSQVTVGIEDLPVFFVIAAFYPAAGAAAAAILAAGHPQFHPRCPAPPSQNCHAGVKPFRCWAIEYAAAEPGSWLAAA